MEFWPGIKYTSQMSVVKEFKDFVLRGNVVDLAVGVIIGTAFNGVVQALVKDLITPLIGIAGGFDFSKLSATVNKSIFLYGTFLNTVISFVIIALVVFFLIVKPINALSARAAAKKALPAPEPNTKSCPFCITDIAVAATRCPNCTSVLSA